MWHDATFRMTLQSSITGDLAKTNATGDVEMHNISLKYGNRAGGEGGKLDKATTKADREQHAPKRDPAGGKPRSADLGCCVRRQGALGPSETDFFHVIISHLTTLSTFLDLVPWWWPTPAASYSFHCLSNQLEEFQQMAVILTAFIGVTN